MRLTEGEEFYMGVLQAFLLPTQHQWIPISERMSDGSLSIAMIFQSLTVLAVFIMALLFCSAVFYISSLSHLIIDLLTCSDVSNTSSNVLEIEKAFALCFLIGVFFFFSTLLSIHLNDVQIFTNLQLDGRLMYKVLTQMLQLSRSEDCWSKRNSYLSPTIWLFDTSGRWSPWKITH